MFGDPSKELSFSGVYRVRDGEVALLTDELQGPNGIALSPDERYLYVGNWDPKRKVVMRYDLDAVGGIAHGRVLFDMTDAPARTRLTDGVAAYEQRERQGHSTGSQPLVEGKAPCVCNAADLRGERGGAPSRARTLLGGGALGSSHARPRVCRQASPRLASPRLPASAPVPVAPTAAFEVAGRHRPGRSVAASGRSARCGW
jgi:hypothetical protein